MNDEFIKILNVFSTDFIPIDVLQKIIIMVNPLLNIQDFTDVHPDNTFCKIKYNLPKIILSCEEEKLVKKKYYYF